MAVEEAVRLGAAYADARFEVASRETLRTLSGNLVRASYDIDRGLGLRVLVNGAWGFMAIGEPTRHDAVVVARRAVASARTSAVLRDQPSEMIESEAHRGLHRTVVERDPLAVPLEDKVGLLLHLDERLREPAEVVMARTRFLAERRQKVLVTSEGAEVEQDLTRIDVALQAGASDGARLRVLSFPDGVASAMSARGWEFVDQLDLEAMAARLGDAAVQQLSVETIPTEPRALVLSPAVVGAHLLEMEPLFRLDRVMGYGSDSGGPGLMGDRIASDGFELVMHPGWSGGAGTYGYDDEGVPAQPVVVVDRGVVVSGLCSRAGAARLGLEASTGTLRAGTWASRPAVHAANWVLSGGDADDVDALIADTRSGVYVESLASLSPSGRDGEFVAVAERAWEIENGRRTRLLDHPIYRGRGTDFFTRVDGMTALPTRVGLGAERAPGLPVGVSAPGLRLRDVAVGHVPEPDVVLRRSTPHASRAVMPPRRRRNIRPIPRRDRF
jgi:TldD protein